MDPGKAYIGCKVGLISKAQNRYEGILFTLDKVNATVVLAKVRCLGTEERPTERPTPPKDDIYEYITFRGSDIKEITVYEWPGYFQGLPMDSAIIQSTTAVPPAVYSSCGPIHPHGLPPYNSLTASSLMNQQYAAAAAFGLGPIPAFAFRRGSVVEKGVQTPVQVERSRLERPRPERRGLAVPQEPEQQPEKKPQKPKVQKVTKATRVLTPSLPSKQVEIRQQNPPAQNKPQPKRKQRVWKPRNRRRGQLKAANVSSAKLKFDTDFDFASSNAQFKKEELERVGPDVVNEKVPADGTKNTEDKENKVQLPAEDPFETKAYYNKAKSFFDNLTAASFRLTWAEERKRNVETFGVPGWFVRGRGFRGGGARRRGKGTAPLSSR